MFHKYQDHDFEVYNDFNSDLVNLFRCVKERTLAFLKEAGFLPINSREEFNFLKSFMEQDRFDDRYILNEISLTRKYFKEPDAAELVNILNKRATDYDVKRAVAFYKLIRYSYASGCKSFGSQPCDLRSTLVQVNQVAYRLSRVVTENKDFEALIRQYDRENSFFYCDPPYVETEGHYAVEFPTADHTRLRDMLYGIKGKFLLSYNDCEFVKSLYKDCHIVEITRINNMAQRYSGGSQFAEVLIANYDMSERRRRMPYQISIFQETENEENYFQDFRNQDKNNKTIYIP